MAAISKVQVRITKYLMCIYGGPMCICIPRMKFLCLCQGEVYTDTDTNNANANDDRQFMIVFGSSVDKPNEPKIYIGLDNAVRMHCKLCI